MPFSDSYANSILNYLFAKTNTLTAPSAVWIGLSTNDPEADSGTFSELSGGGYGRVLISLVGEAYPNQMGSASDRAITNQAQINWTKATMTWDRVKGFGLFSSETGGSPFFYGALELSEDDAAAGGLLVESGAVCLFDPYTLRISFPANDSNS